MPKKRHNNFKAITAQHSSASSANNAASSSSSTRGVNERLAQLRLEQSPRPTLQQRDELTTLATSHTLPPHLRRILNVPETAAPLPRPGMRRHRGWAPRGERPPPGPAAPASWVLASSLHAPKGVKAAARQRAREAGTLRDLFGISGGFSRLARLEDGVQELPAERSLIDMALKGMARDWGFVAEYEQLNLAALPMRWKVGLISYLGVYGPEEGVTGASLKTLFLTEDELEGATGGEELARLDLTGLISGKFSILDLERFLYRKGDPVEHKENAKEKQPAEPVAEDEVAETWEDEASDTIDQAPKLTPGLRIKRFPNLTRLSLAHAGAHASWSHLLSLTSRTPTLTHLSLAHWPLPTTTPNSKTAFITHNHAAIPVSGSHFYAELDNDWAEPASVLRRLSSNTYQLQWLDLEGCEQWFPALTWAGGDDTLNRWTDRTFGTPEARRGSVFPPEGEDPLRPSQGRAFSGPDWTGSWSQLSYLNLSQAVIPRSAKAVQAYPAGVVAAELLLWLRDHPPEDDEPDVVVDIPVWLKRERTAREVERNIRRVRHDAGCGFLEVDHGWTRPVGEAAARRVRHDDD